MPRAENIQIRMSNSNPITIPIFCQSNQHQNKDYPSRIYTISQYLTQDKFQRCYVCQLCWLKHSAIVSKPRSKHVRFCHVFPKLLVNFQKCIYLHYSYRITIYCEIIKGIRTHGPTKSYSLCQQPNSLFTTGRYILH